MAIPNHIESEIGLVFGMIGVVIIFIWGPPQPSFESPAVARSGREADKEREESAKQRKWYQRNSRFGLALIFVGFGLQFLDLLTH
jgi:hypothetical protein